MTPELAQRLTKALKVLTDRSILLEARFAWYCGEHPSTLGTRAWLEAYGKTYGRIIDNRTGAIIDTRAEAVTPASFELRGAGNPADEVLARWATEILEDHQQACVEVAASAKWSGFGVTIAPDWGSDGAIHWYVLGPRSCYVARDKAGTYLWAVNLWKDEDTEFTHATYYHPAGDIHLVSTSKRDLPGASEFEVAPDGERVHGYGEVLVSQVDEKRSLVDELWPTNALLNKSMQMQAVSGESYTLPLRLFLGIETYDEHTGEVNAVIPSLDPRTASQNVSIPTVQDAEGETRQVIQLTSPDPSKFISEQEQHRLSMSALGKVPSFLVVAGGTPPSGDALEMLYLPFVGAKHADERIYRPFHERLGELTIRMRLYQLTGQYRPAPRLRVNYSELSTSTVSSRVQNFSTAVAAGMSLADALVDFLGWSRETADAAQAEQLAMADEASTRSARAFSAGVLED